MQSESIPLSFLSIISLLSFFIFLIISKYSKNIANGQLLDKDFNKPQAFHNQLIARTGGLASIIVLNIFFIFYYIIFQSFLFDYFFLSMALFSLGFLEDIEFKISPKFRLLFMIISLIIFINLFSLSINSVDLVFLSSWMHNNLFSIFFLVLCFLFIINGSNLIDGFNGLLSIHLIIINLILLFLNLNNDYQNIIWIFISQIIILFSFLVFNFPKAQIFMGDSGSYLFGSITALSIIKTNNNNPEISSFFFCILLFYLFFEVFFSFFRKISQKKSPLLPDENHLHMLVYRGLKQKGWKNANPVTGFVINFFYLALIIPALFNILNPLFCKFWFFFLIFIYSLVFYYLFGSKKI